MLICRTVDMDVNGEFQTAKKLVVKMKGIVGCRFRKWPMLEILWSIGYTYKRCNDGRKFSTDHTDVVAARAMFLWTTHKITLVQPRCIIIWNMYQIKIT
jgi:hypothetical protein